MDVCEHGTLRRKCEVCHLNGEVAELEAKLAAAEKRADDEATVARTQEARAWDADQRTIEAIAVSADREAQQADDDHVREALRFAMANPGGE